jgi:hypothetical protein
MGLNCGSGRSHGGLPVAPEHVEIWQAGSTNY